MNRTHFLLLAFALAGCRTKDNSALIITKVVPPTAVTTGTTTTCTVDPKADEVSFLAYNPAENQGVVGAVVSNQILNTNVSNVVLRLDTSTFLPHQAVIDYEVIGGGATVGRQVVPVSGVEVTGNGGLGSVAVIMFPKPSDVAALAAGTFIRTTFHIEGRLADYSTVHTSEREYLFRICKTAGCSGNPCF